MGLFPFWMLHLRRSRLAPAKLFIWFLQEAEGRGLASCVRPALSRRDEVVIFKSTAAFPWREQMMDVPHHIRSMSNDNAALRHRRTIRHLRASLPSSVSTCRRVIGRRVAPDLVSPYHSPSITASVPRPPRPPPPLPSPPHLPTFTRVDATEPR